jgi:hypothetical protein
MKGQPAPPAPGVVLTGRKRDLLSFSPALWLEFSIRTRQKATRQIWMVNFTTVKIALPEEGEGGIFMCVGGGGGTNEQC